jgi:hypothetical protein
MEDLWAFRDQAVGDIDIVGFTVRATDGKAGKVDEASHEAGSCCVVVDTGGFRGHKVLLPAGLVEHVDPASESVHVALAKADVKHGPDYDPIGVRAEDYRARVASYFEGLGAGRETQV